MRRPAFSMRLRKVVHAGVYDKSLGFLNIYECVAESLYGVRHSRPAHVRLVVLDDGELSTGAVIYQRESAPPVGVLAAGTSPKNELNPARCAGLVDQINMGRHPPISMRPPVRSPATSSGTSS